MTKNSCKLKIKNKLKKGVGIIVVFVIGLLFLIEGMQDLITLEKWDNGGILEYSGNYTLTKKKHYRNTGCTFVLGNGDKIYVPSEYLNSNNFIESSEKITFRYAIHKDIFTYGSHPCVSITSIDGAYVIVSEEKVQNDFVLGVIIYLLLGAIAIFFALIPFLNLNIVIRIVRTYIGRQRTKRDQSGDGSMIKPQNP